MVVLTTFELNLIVSFILSNIANIVPESKCKNEKKSF